MDILLGGVFVCFLVFFYLKKRKLNPKINTLVKRPFKQQVQDGFSNYRIIDKNNMLMICEYNHRNEPEELVFIRINRTLVKKNLKHSGRMLIAEYPYEPSLTEMRSDFAHYLK